MSRQRTNPQNKALYLWFDQWAEELNNAGYEQKITIGTIDAPWNKDRVHDMFVKIAYAMFKKKHTSDLTTKELKEVSETLIRALGEKGINVPFPSIESLLQEREEGEHLSNNKNK